MFTPRSRTSRIDPEEVHDVLRNDRRRLTLQYLKQRLEPVEVRELSERVAELEVGESPAPRNIRQSVYNALNQTHLPKLDETGLVEFDRDRKIVSLRETARDLDVYMNVVTPLGIAWDTYYRSLGVVALVTVLAADTDLAFFAGVDSLVFATVFLFAFALSTSYQLWSLRWFYLRWLMPDD
jgi:DNA-binding transcriptional ArsR family regulator